MSAKVVVLGGSGVATPELINAILQTPARTRHIELVLVGRDADKLGQVASIARLLAGNDPCLSIHSTTQIEAGLEGADYILNQIRVGGLEARAFDESFPQEFGLPGEETVGPGGFANASRTIPAVLNTVRLMEQICPEATLLNFTNPSSLIVGAVVRYSNIKVVGLCNGPVLLWESIAKALGAPMEQVTIDYVGMHHFGWVVGVWWRGQDMLAQALAKVAEINREVEPQIAQAIGAIPGPYLNYVFHPDRILHAKANSRTRAEELLELQSEIRDDYEQSLLTGQKPTSLAQRKARWYKDIVVPVILALAEGRASTQPAARFIVNIVNTNAVTWLSPDAIVEVPTIFENGQFYPLTTRAVPLDARALIQANCAYEMLAIQAIVERDREKALRALMINPIVHTYDQAAGVLARAWAAG